jgi:hypothetical protein
VVFELAPGKYSKEDLEANFKSVTEAIKKVRPLSAVFPHHMLLYPPSSSNQPTT